VNSQKRQRVVCGMGGGADCRGIAKGTAARILRTEDTTFASGLIGLRIYGDPIKPCDATFLKVTF